MLNVEKRLWIIKQRELNKLSVSEIASVQKVNRRTVERIWGAYNYHGKQGIVPKEVGRPKQKIPDDVEELIIKIKKNNGFGVRKIEGIIGLKGIKISHNKIHEILTNANLIEHNPKKGRRCNYIRWERKHSNSLWQTDFCWISKLDCWLCAWLNDHSRFVTAADYLTEATTENAINLFEKAAKKYGYPRETLSDRGTQFYANLGETCRFLEHMKSRNINHIYASIKKPTTCGKLERFWGTHNRERWNFPSLLRFLNYYNYKRPHMSLGWYNPYSVYVRDIM